ncbi:MAG: Protein of uncharacterized function [Frankiales bacterium]|nr:Protein of uncharacterized function [Frankiales bacterium]
MADGARSAGTPAAGVPGSGTPGSDVPGSGTSGSGTSAAAPTRPALVEALGGKRGLIDSGLPAIVFVLVNSVVDAFAARDTALNAAIAASVLSGLAIVVLRLVRKETLQQAISGFLGLGLAVFFAARSGEARGFFLPGIWINVAYGVAFLGSALVGRPIVGAIYGAVEGLGTRWREDARLRRVFALASVGWSLVFAARASVQGVLYVMDRPGLLAAARLLMGWPLTIGAVALTVAYVKRARGHVDAPGGPARA